MAKDVFNRKVSTMGTILFLLVEKQKASRHITIYLYTSCYS